MTKQCQSCGMPLKKVTDAGTETDGRPSVAYCAMCYADGAFTDPDATAAQMQEIADRAMKEQGIPWLLRQLAIRQIPSLARWKKART